MTKKTMPDTKNASIISIKEQISNKLTYYNSLISGGPPRLNISVKRIYIGVNDLTDHHYSEEKAC